MCASFFLSPLGSTCRLCLLLAHRCLVIIIFYKFCAIISPFFFHVHFSTHRMERAEKRKKKNNNNVNCHRCFSVLATTASSSVHRVATDTTTAKKLIFSLVACAQNTCISRMVCCQFVSKNQCVSFIVVLFHRARSFLFCVFQFISLRLLVVFVSNSTHCSVPTCARVPNKILSIQTSVRFPQSALCVLVSRALLTRATLRLVQHRPECSLSGIRLFVS